SLHLGHSDPALESHSSRARRLPGTRAPTGMLPLHRSPFHTFHRLSNRPHERCVIQNGIGMRGPFHIGRHRSTGPRNPPATGFSILTTWLDTPSQIDGHTP